ncbi:hypothetical protein [[Phormidium] sp. ETS-05]|nr:hypothetical protein [[Phormidium] sp. ETS-05]
MRSGLSEKTLDSNVVIEVRSDLPIYMADGRLFLVSSLDAGI